MRIGIIAALPGELKPLVRGWARQQPNEAGVRMWWKSSGEYELVAACAGMGADAARRSFAAIEAAGKLDMILSVGWTGALARDIQSGRCYMLSEIVDAQTGERFSLTSREREFRLVTTTHVADAVEKRRLSQTYGAALVDMEAATIARLAQMRGLPMGCFKAVSDGIDAKLPNLNPFIDPRGQLRMLPFLFYIALRPQYWGSLVRLGRTCERAAKELAQHLELFLQNPDLETTNRTGSIEGTI